MTQMTYPGQAVVAKRRMVIDGRVVEPGERLPDHFTNRSDELIKMFLRSGFVEVAPNCGSTTVPASAPAPQDTLDPDKKALLDQVESLDYTSLRETCRVHGLPSTGSKDVLRKRLKDFLLGA